MESVWFSRPHSQQQQQHQMNDMRSTTSFHPAPYRQPPRMRQVQNQPPHQGFSRPTPPPTYPPPVMGRGPIPPEHRGMRMPPHGDQHQRAGPPSFHMQPHMLPPGAMMVKHQQQNPSLSLMSRHPGHALHRSDAPRHHFQDLHAAHGRNPENHQRSFQRPNPHYQGPLPPPPTYGMPPHQIMSNPIVSMPHGGGGYPGPRNHMIPIPGSPASIPSQSPGPSPPPPPPPLNGRLSFPPTLRQLKAAACVSASGPLASAPLRESRSQNVVVPTEVVSAPTPKTPTASEGQQHPKPQEQDTPPKATTTTNGVVKFEALQDAASILLELRSSSSPPTIASEEQEQRSDDGSTDIYNEQREEDEEMRCNDDEGDQDPPVMEVPKSFPSRLSLPGDESWLNSLHCFLRSELLEVFVVEKSQTKSPTHSPGSSVGRVGLRCVHCAQARKKGVGQPSDDRGEAPMAVFYPKCISEIYRLVTSWQRCHLRKCRNLPPDVRAKWTILRETDKSRGKTQYWVTSAREIGLVDCSSRAGGVRFALESV